MKKKYALLLSFLITSLIASNIFLLSILDKEPLETAIVARVIDGDTLELDDGRTLRLLNINAPEKSVSSYKLSSDYLKNFENASILLEITEKDKYQRDLARIYSPDKDYINLELVKEGFASKFLVESSELKIFKKAEQKAISEGKGIWKHSEYYNCLTSQIDKNDEFLIIYNNCPEINLAGWTLKDESTKQFTFPNLQFEKITIHSGEGENNISDLFWQKKTNVWNNDRDSAYIFDSNGFIVHYSSYGY